MLCVGVVGVGYCKQLLFNQSRSGYLYPMSTVKEIEAAIPKLSRAEIEQIREWIDDYLEE